jgi:hypothetical protein
MNTIKHRLCEFVDIGFDTYACQNCGLIISSFDGPPALICSAIKITEAIKSADPSKTCSEQEIVNRYSICMSCDFFKNNTCDKCGCKVVRNSEFQNKLFWKDQSCPINKW